MRFQDVAKRKVKEGEISDTWVVTKRKRVPRNSEIIGW